MEKHDGRAGQFILPLSALVLLFAVARVLQPLTSALTAAGVLAVVIHPLYARLLARRPRAPDVAAGAVTAATCVAIALPLILAASYFIREAVHAYPLLREWLQGDEYLQDLNLKVLLMDNLSEAGSWAGRALRSTAGNAALLAFDGIAFVVCLFLFLRDGPTILDRLQGLVPLPPESKDKIIRRTHDMVVATVQGVFVTAVLQGTLAAIGFALFHVRFPVLLGGLCMLFSPLPFVGPTIVWLPVVLRVAVEGMPWRAAAMASWFLLTVGTLDHVVRPFFIGSRSSLPVPLVVIGVLGGIQAFGPIGTFLGPVVIAIAVAVLNTLFAKAEDGTR